MLSTSEAQLIAWPGKSVPGGGFYSAACHMLDVGAVAEILVERTALPVEQKQALVVLAALHDIGKISAPFRDMLHGFRSDDSWRHWKLSESHLLDMDGAILDPGLGGKKSRRFRLYASSAGHHGKPPRTAGDDFVRMRKAIGDDARSSAGDFIKLCLTYWPQASLDGLTEGQSLALSWWLPGFVTVCDWVGSNTDWFKPVMEAASLTQHLDQARQRAGIALREAGLLPSPIRDEPLYPFALRPMQKAAVSLALHEGPMLAIIEDETGAGKTEAAMLLAQRMLLGGKGNGIFFALPTMATSNAMFLRAEKTVGKLFDSPSLTLAHGRASLNVAFKDVIGRKAGGEDDVTCAPWLADGRRRALLAQVGVGTIDQAFLSVLPTRHNALRIWGLSQKILIVDEVHELGNPYMAEELKKLLHSHAMQGGSAILLSATLPLKLRQDLADAFEQGAGRQPVPLNGRAYPSLVIANGGAAIAVKPGERLRSKVRVERLGDAEAAARLLAGAAEKGAACLWIRNSVDDAIAAARMLEALGQAPMLFHARYAFADRQRIETDVLAFFGRCRKADGGRILVATQVAESSLDLDFDVMVSDLAPMAALIQRSGRLWRHMAERPKKGRPVSEPVLHVLSPDPRDIANARWLSAVMNKGEYVYPAADQWRTAMHLFAAGWIDAPDGLRDLIEAVHGSAVADVPAVLLRAELNAIGEAAGQKNRGQHNTIDLEKDYRNGGAEHDDVNYPTRLGLEQRSLMLVRRDSGVLRLWAGEGIEGEMRSEVSVSKRRLDDFALPEPGSEAPELQAFKKDWPEWKKKSLTVVEVDAEGKLAEGLHYSPAYGLLW